MNISWQQCQSRKEYAELQLCFTCVQNKSKERCFICFLFSTKESITFSTLKITILQSFQCSLKTSLSILPPHWQLCTATCSSLNAETCAVQQCLECLCQQIYIDVNTSFSSHYVNGLFCSMEAPWTILFKLRVNNSDLS